MKKVFVALSFLLLLSYLSQSFPALSLMSLGLGPDKLHAAEKQKAQQPTDWKDLPPKVQKFILELGKEELIQEKYALQDALKWLELVDKGNYKEACESVSDLTFAAAMGDIHEIDECSGRLKRTRKTLGRMVSRNSITAKAMSHDLSGFVVVFSTVFKKKNVKEIIILHRPFVDQYFIQRGDATPQLIIPKPGSF
jgi:hypothetical protein